MVKMRLRSRKNSQSHQASLALKGCLEKFDYQLLKPFLLYASSALSMAIVLLGSPVQAEEQLPVLSGSKNTTLELNTLLHSDSLNKNQTIANSGEDSDEVVPNQQPDYAQTLPAVSKEPVHSAEALKQVANSSAELHTESTEPVPLNHRIVQADAPTPQPSELSSPSASSDRWQFSVEPYFFIPLDVQADSTVAGRSASIQLGLGDILNLDRAFDAGLRLEAQNNRLGLILDGFYISAAQSGNIGVTFPQGSLQRFGINTAARAGADGSISTHKVTVDAAVSYRVLETVLGNSAASSNLYPRLTVAPILGLRTRVLWQELEVGTARIGNISLPVNQEFRSSGTTIEPLVGTQIGLDLSERWTINFRGDVSGFNINADQDFTWNLLIGTQYHLSPSISLQLAYLFNGFDFENGEGLRRTQLNLYQNGLWLGSVFRF